MATTEPLKTREQLEQVRAVLASNRDRCLFTMGVNAAFRGGDLLSLNVGDVAHLKAGEELVRKEQKTGKTRRVTLNAACVAALRVLVLERLDAGATKDSPLFVSAKRGNRLGISDLSRMWKMWCSLAGLEGSFASHSGRKTFGYMARVEGRASVEVLMKAYNHASAATTLTYLCVQDSELAALYSTDL